MALNSLDAQEERLIYAYRQKAISLDQLKAQKEKPAPKQREVEAALEALTHLPAALQPPKITRDS